MRTMKCSVRMAALSMCMMLSLWMNIASAALTNRPQDTESVVGKSASFECTSTVEDQEIQWIHYPLGSKEKYVYAYGTFLVPYLGRFNLDSNFNSSGISKIIILEVAQQDAGIYECQDDDGNGESSQASLTVLHSEPVCKPNMTAGQVIIETDGESFTPDFLQLSCSVNYTGTIPPQLEWMKTDVKVQIRDGVTHGRIGNTVVSNLTLEGRSQLDGQEFICQTTKPSVSEKPTCSPGKLKVQRTSSWKTVLIVVLTVLVPLLIVALAVSVYCVKKIRQKNKRAREIARNLRMEAADLREKQMIANIHERRGRMVCVPAKVSTPVKQTEATKNRMKSV